MIEKYSPVIPVKKLKKRLKKMKAEGEKKLGIEICTEIYKSAINEMSQLFHFVLFNTPESKNYLSTSFVGDNGKPIFDICLHKAGKRWPGDPMLLLDDHAVEDLVKAARELRAAQKAYMAKRAKPSAETEALGKAVGEKAQLLDLALVRFEVIEGHKNDPQD